MTEKMFGRKQVCINYNVYEFTTLTSKLLYFVFLWRGEALSSNLRTEFYRQTICRFRHQQSKYEGAVWVYPSLHAVCQSCKRTLSNSENSICDAYPKRNSQIDFIYITVVIILSSNMYIILYVLLFLFACW